MREDAHRYSPFQSTLSMRRATSGLIRARNADGISIHALHEESDLVQAREPQPTTISIHALHEESDRVRRECNRILKISIHALHEESDALVFLTASHGSQFQSTLSMRRATACLTHQGIEETISIHALHEESDRTMTPIRPLAKLFQSTLSMRRATTPIFFIP